MVAERLVIVGASLAGIRAAEAARKSGFTGAITMIGAEQYVPYDRPPLSKAYLDDKDEPRFPSFRTNEYLSEELNVDLRLGTRATSLNAQERSVNIESDRADHELGYDALVIATGAAARELPETSHLAGVHTLRTIDDANAVRAALENGARTVVVGAGFIGSEVASAARKRDLPVTVVESLPVPLVRSVGEHAGKACTELHRANGTDLRFGVTVVAVEGSSGSVERVVLDDGTVLEADLVVVGIGVRPSTDWLVGSGVDLHERDGGIVCDETLATGLPGVYAAGDVVHWPNPLFDGELMRLEHWTNAAEQGALAAKNSLAPHDAKPAASVPYFWSDWYDSRIQFVGIPSGDEIRVVSEELDDSRFLALYRKGDRLAGVLTIDRPTQIMKYRRLIARQASWREALEFAGAVGP